MGNFQNIQVNSLPLKDVVRDIARGFGTHFTENCEEYKVEIPPLFGNGYIKGINFDGGLGLLEYNCTFKTDFEIQFIVGDVHPLKFLYCRKGALAHTFENSIEKHELEKHQNTIVASQSHNGHILAFKAGVHTIINSLEIDRGKFQSKMECELKMLEENFKNLLLDTKANHEFFYKGFYSLELSNIFETDSPLKENEFLHKILMEGQAYQILAHQVFQYDEDVKHGEDRHYLRKAEVELVEEAIKILENELSDRPTIEQLARRVGLAENKLQQGFRYFFGTSINRHVQEKRLEISRGLLQETDYSIAEIADILGVSSKSYFSKVFKAKYGISPSTFRKMKGKA